MRATTSVSSLGTDTPIWDQEFADRYVAIEADRVPPEKAQRDEPAPAGKKQPRVRKPRR